MSRLTDTKRAYDKLVQLLDQEIRKRSGSAADLEAFRKSLDVAYYLLAWAQFEYLVRQETTSLIEVQAAGRKIEAHAWRFMKENIRTVSVRDRLDLIFNSDQKIRDSLDDDYTMRNEAAHNHKILPRNAIDISAWIQKLEDLVDRF